MVNFELQFSRVEVRVADIVFFSAFLVLDFDHLDLVIGVST